MLIDFKKCDHLSCNNSLSWKSEILFQPKIKIVSFFYRFLYFFLWQPVYMKSKCQFLSKKLSKVILKRVKYIKLDKLVQFVKYKVTQIGCHPAYHFSPLEYFPLITKTRLQNINSNTLF